MKTAKIAKIFKQQGFANRIFLLFLCGVILFLGVAGCSKEQKQEATTISDTRIVVDCLGREVEIPAKVERVACLYAFAGHVTLLLDQGDKIVAVVNGLKRDKLVTAMFPEILDKPTPFEENNINVEELLEINPDVVFVRESTYNNQADMNKLAAFGIPVVVIDSGTLEQQRQGVAVAAQVFQGEAIAIAQAYDDFFTQALAYADSKRSQLLPDDLKEIFHSINEATRTDIPNTLTAQWLERVGVDNVALEASANPLDGKAYVTLEQIYQWDPEVIICNETGVPNYILTDPKWAGLAAVNSGQVYQMPVGVSRWGHPGSVETPLAIYWLGCLLYQDLYKDLDLVAKTKEFYQSFFRVDLTNSQVQEILKGEGMRLEKPSKQAQ